MRSWSNSLARSRLLWSAWKPVHQVERQAGGQTNHTSRGQWGLVKGGRLQKGQAVFTYRLVGRSVGRSFTVNIRSHSQTCHCITSFYGSMCSPTCTSLTSFICNFAFCFSNITFCSHIRFPRLDAKSRNLWNRLQTTGQSELYWHTATLICLRIVGAAFVITATAEWSIATDLSHTADCIYSLALYRKD